MRVFFLGLCLSYSFLFADSPEKEIVVVIPSYNNQEWYVRNLTSVLEQNYHNFRVIYVNDCSTDGTAEGVEALARSYAPDSVRVCSFDASTCDTIPETVEKFKETVGGEKVFFTLVNNKHRCGPLENLYLMTHSCEDHQIVVTVDGDDWLYDNDVFHRLNEVYSNGDIWMTHGMAMNYPDLSRGRGLPFPSEVVASGAVRKWKRFPSHLRTYYAWLFKKIELKDLLYKGNFFPASGDRAIMFPILEMAAERHHFFSEYTYIYNKANPINIFKVNGNVEYMLMGYIADMKPYQRLEKADGGSNK